MGRDTLIEKEIKRLHSEYTKRWYKDAHSLEETDELINDLLNELEDIFNPSRINGN